MSDEQRFRFSHLRRWRRMAWLSVFLLQVGSLVAAPVLSGSPEARKHELWLAYRQAKTLGDEAAQEQAFDAFRELRDRYASEIFESAGFLFLEEGQREFALGHYQEARSEFLNAVKMNPFLWPAYEGLAKVRREKDGDFRGFMYLNFKGLTSAFDLTNAYFVLDVMVWFVKNLLWTLFFSVAAFAALLAIRYARTWQATTAAYFEKRGSSAFARLFALCLLLIPLALGFNLILAAGLLLVFFMPFLERRERATAGVWLALIAVAPLLSAALAHLNHVRSDELLRAHLTQFFEGDLQERIDFLEANPAEGALGHYSHFTIGRLKKMKGDYEGAEAAYEQIPETAPIWPLAKTNVGNLRYLRNEYQQAQEAYNAALAKERNLALALYNLGVVKNQLGEHREAESLRARALDLDEELRSRLVLFEELSTDNVIDAEPNYEGRLRAALFSLVGGDRWRGAPDLIGGLIVGGVLLLLGLLHLGLRNARLLARACEKCGRVFFRSDSPDGEWCGQCVSIYIKKEDLPSEAKAKKVAQVRNHQKRNRRINIIAQLIAPGARGILKSGVASGSIALAVWVFLLVNCLLPLASAPSPYLQYLESPGLLMGFNFGVLAVYWLIFGLRPAWQEE